MSKPPNKKASKAKKTAQRASRVDRAVTHKAAAWREHPLLRATAFLSEAADQPPLITASLGTLAIGLLTQRRELVRGGARMLTAHLLATAGKAVIKHTVDRTRPKKALRDGYHAGKARGADDHELNSFPSGHTAGAVAVSRALSHEVASAAVPGALATGVVAATQPAAGNHYISDVIAGAVIGWVAEAITGAIFNRAEPVVEGVTDTLTGTTARAAPAT